MLLLSDFVGLVASLFLVVPGAKDNFYRFREAEHRRKKENSPWPGLHTFVIEGWKYRRDTYSPWDSFWMLVGGLGLAGSFVLKIFGM
jgi:hypothetical protein